MYLIDGGDLACGELLILVSQRVRELATGTLVGIATTDPAAVIDIPAWCHLTGHSYEGTAGGAPRGPFLIRLQPTTHVTDPRHPWRRTHERNYRP